MTELKVEFGSGTLTGVMSKDTFFIGNAEIPETEFLEITK